MTEAYSAPWKVAGVASTPTTPLREVSAAGLTAGSIPTKGTWGKSWRKLCRAQAEAVLHATTMILLPRASRKRVIASEKERTCSIGRGP